MSMIGCVGPFLATTAPAPPVVADAFGSWAKLAPTPAFGRGMDAAAAAGTVLDVADKLTRSKTDLAVATVDWGCVGVRFSATSS